MQRELHEPETPGVMHAEAGRGLDSRGMDRALKPEPLRQAIAGSVSANLKAYNVPGYCAQLGLPVQEGDSAFSSKAVYVGNLLLGLDVAQLLDVAQQVLAEWDDPDLQALVDLAGVRGVRGELKNLIFASVGTKPQIVLRDAVNNVVEITEGADRCLVYDRPLSERGLPWSALVDWWAQHHLKESNLDAAARHLWQRLSASLDSDAERLLFTTYTKRYGQDPDTLALLPQVWLHYDPYLRPRQQLRPGSVIRQRMDFLLLMPGRRRIVLEVDGRHHYAGDDGRADPQRYATMVTEDRRLRLTGYEVYRFGGAELVHASTATTTLNDFFDELLAGETRPHL